MKLFLLEDPEWGGYDVWDSCVVAAENGAEAILWHPIGHRIDKKPRPFMEVWPSHPRVTYLGEAREGMPAGVVCASFNAG